MAVRLPSAVNRMVRDIARVDSFDNNRRNEVLAFDPGHLIGRMVLPQSRLTVSQHELNCLHIRRIVFDDGVGPIRRA